MLGIGWFEIFVVAAGALIVVGPKDLPKMLRNVGKFVGAARRSVDQIRAEFNQVIQTEEISSLRKSMTEPLQDLRKDLDDASKLPDIDPNVSSNPTKMSASSAEAKADAEESVYDDIMAVTKAEGDELVEKSAALDAKTFKPEAEEKAVTPKRKTTRAKSRTTKTSTAKASTAKKPATTKKPATRKTTTASANKTQAKSPAKSSARKAASEKGGATRTSAAKRTAAKSATAKNSAPGTAGKASSKPKTKSASGARGAAKPAAKTTTRTTKRTTASKTATTGRAKSRTKTSSNSKTSKAPA